MCLVFLNILLISRPAHAQALPPGWTAVPCDVNGNTNGLTGFQGTQSGNITRTGTYQDINDFITNNPDYYDNPNYETAAAYFLNPAWLNNGTSEPTGSIGVGSTSDYGSEDGMQARNYDYDGPTDGFLSAPGYNNEAINGTLATNVSGGLTVYFKLVWQGSGPQPSYPASMSLKVTTTLTTTGSVSYGKADVTSGLMATANASDSLGDNNSASVASPTDTSPAPVVTSYIVSASVGSSGIASYGFSGTADMSVSNTVPFTDYPGGRGSYTDYAVANANATVAAQAAPDSRQVVLSANVDVTNKKQALLSAPGVASIDANGDENFFPSPNIRSTNGTMYGDTIYSYVGHHDGAQDAFNINWITFTPTFTGNWHDKEGTTHNGDSITVPDVVDPDTWKWSPNESQDSWDYGLCSMPLAPNYAIVNGYAQGQDLPSIYNVGYSATDNTDQAQGSANYIMTLHDPVEKNYPDHKTSDFVNPRQVSGNLISSGPSDVLGGGIAIQIDYSLSISLSGPEASWVARVLGINLTASVEQDYQTISNIATTGLPAGWYTSVVEYDHYYDHVGKTDGWSTTGYTGTDPYYIREIPSAASDQWGIKMAPPTQGDSSSTVSH